MKLDQGRKYRLKILLYARSTGFRLVRINDWNYVLRRISKDGTQTVNVYWNSKNSFFTLLTAIDHPKQGKTQLTRKYLDVDDVLKLLNNPRSHTGRGYYQKP